VWLAKNSKDKHLENFSERGSTMIRKTIPDDSSALLAILESSGQFDANSLEQVKATLASYLDGTSENLWFTADDGEPVGVAYCAPEPVTDGTWNLLLLWTRPDRHRQGHGSALFSQVENVLRERGVRLLIVETSGLDAFEPARKFYDWCGFRQEARVRNFFAAGDDKLIYTKSLLADTSED
jgi:ribosomal protein S18 acetylase RimI-like enzyme